VDEAVVQHKEPHRLASGLCEETHADVGADVVVFLLAKAANTGNMRGGMSRKKYRVNAEAMDGISKGIQPKIECSQSIETATTSSKS